MEDNIIEKIKAKIQFHENEVKRFKDILFAVENLDFEAFPKEPSNKSITSKNEETFKTSILNILKENKELTSKEILKAYNKRTGKELDLKQFSGRLSILTGTAIEKIVYPNNTMSARNMYKIKAQ